MITRLLVRLEKRSNRYDSIIEHDIKYHKSSYVFKKPTKVGLTAVNYVMSPKQILNEKGEMLLLVDLTSIRAYEAMIHKMRIK